MKKTILFALPLLVALSACTKQKPVTEEPVKKQIITAYVNIATKVSYEENTPGGGGGMSSLWDKGDTFLAIQDSSKVVEFSLISGEGTNIAVFQAETDGVTSQSTWKAVFGKGTVHGTEVHCGYLDQSGKLESLDNFTYITADGTGLTPTFDFQNGTHLSYVLRVKVPEGTRFIEYTPCAYNKVTPNGAELIYLNSGENEDYFSSSRCSTIELGAAATAGDIVYISVPCINGSNTYTLTNNDNQHQNIKAGIVLTFLNNDSDNATLSNGVVINEDFSEKGGMVKTVNCGTLTLISRPRPQEAIKFETHQVTVSFSTSKQQAKNVITYWAPYNVGASVAHESGKYYMFGTSEQLDLTVNPSTDVYPFFTNAPKGYMSMGHQHAKLMNNDYNTTFYSIQGSKYDAARVIWGRAWRMPHIIELQTLYEAEKSAVTLSSQNCATFTNAITNNELTIPAVGVYKNGSHEDTEYAVIWSADKNQRSADNTGWDSAYVFDIRNKNGYIGAFSIERYEMCCAIPIRPVLASSEFKNVIDGGTAPIWEEKKF